MRGTMTSMRGLILPIMNACTPPPPLQLDVARVALEIGAEDDAIATHSVRLFGRARVSFTTWIVG